MTVSSSGRDFFSTKFLALTVFPLFCHSHMHTKKMNLSVKIVFKKLKLFSCSSKMDVKNLNKII